MMVSTLSYIKIFTLCCCAPVEAAGSSSERNWAALQRAWRPYAAAWKAHWWECVAIPDDVTDAAGFRSGQAPTAYLPVN